MGSQILGRMLIRSMQVSQLRSNFKPVVLIYLQLDTMRVKVLSIS